MMAWTLQKFSRRCFKALFWLFRRCVVLWSVALVPLKQHVRPIATENDDKPGANIQGTA